MFSDREIPSHRFNAGEKIVFWGGVLTLGAVVVGSGLYLDKILPGKSIAWDARGTVKADAADCAAGSSF